MANERISEFGGIPLVYDRSTQADYGRGGSPYRPYVETGFADDCEACFTELFAALKTHAGLEVETILTGGVSRAGSGRSLHHQNRAFDLDGLLFNINPHWNTKTFPTRPQIYLGIEAILRKHFGTVLSYDYNRAHRDHFHFDNGTSLGLKTSAKSHVVFLQNVVSMVYLTPIGRDGLWGAQTSGAVINLRNRMGVGGLSNRQNWNDFLTKVAEDAFILELDRLGPIPDPVEMCECCGQEIA